MSIVVVNHISLDAVMQGPGRPDEDTRDGFVHGGWAELGSSHDPEMQAAMRTRMGDGFAWLFGRRSYEDMLGHWNAEGGPFKDGLNATPKFVASSNPSTKLKWPNSELVTGDVPTSIAELRRLRSGNLVIMGSGQLIRSLFPLGLIDELFLMIHPLVIGSGHRLFGPDDDMHRLRLVECTATANGVLLATYRT